MPQSPAVSHTGRDVHPVHPLGSRARVLLTSVFGPFAQDDDYGSRLLNPMELYHNQVTRVQHAFSLRMFHRSWGIMLIQANISAPCTLLDFPTLDRFIEEITRRPYDIVGITSIMQNVAKVETMCALIRKHLPDATILVGGHVANVPGLADRADVDHVVRGEGVRWMQRFLDEDPTRPIRHPAILSGLGARSMGMPLRSRPGDTAATLIPSVGCPMGCNFCSTSAMFGGKGKFIHFFETGDELFKVMCDLEESMKVQSFFVMDENFLLHRARALRLLELMVEHGKSWSLYLFTSANVLRKYDIEQLVELGVSWVWLGLEGEETRYAKLAGIDTRDLVRTLQSHGIRVLGSSIIGLEHHTPENIDAVIDHAVSHDTEFHQFMLYMPIPGTPLHREHVANGTMLDTREFPEADYHGQHRFNFRHPHITGGQEEEFLLRAFERDFVVNGPSILRVARTLLRGYRRYKNHPDARIRARFLREARELPSSYAGALWASARWFRSDPGMATRIRALLDEIHREFGLRSRLAAMTVGRVLRHTLAREARRLQRGWTYEPPMFCESTGSTD
ncbi:MAG: B12-binding domain-containing radical SAM protein [Acidobacteriota bacterium]